MRDHRQNMAQILNSKLAQSRPSRPPVYFHTYVSNICRWVRGRCVQTMLERSPTHTVPILQRPEPAAIKNQIELAAIRDPDGAGRRIGLEPPHTPTTISFGPRKLFFASRDLGAGGDLVAGRGPGAEGGGGVFRVQTRARVQKTPTVETSS